MRPVLPTSAVAIKSIEPKLVLSPVYELIEGPQKTFTPRRWLQVAVRLITRPNWIEQLTFQYRLDIAGRLFTGSITHVNIAAGTDHLAGAFLIPSAVESLLHSRKIDPQTAVGVEVWVMDGETVLARRSFGIRESIGGPETPGLLRSVGETPFAPLGIDLYEQVSPPEVSF